MGIETVAGIGAGAGALGGAIKGAKGTPAKTETTTTNIAPAGAQEQALQQSSLQNYMAANGLAGQIEQNIGGAQGYQDQARQAGGNILNGQAFNLTPQEQANIANQRQALVAAGQNDINIQQAKDLQGAQADAANRGLRGQAMGALQGQVYQASQNANSQLAMQANQLAAQQASQMPLQRIQAQSGLIQQGMSLADLLRQQALTNRNNLQDPALMASLQRERMAGASRTSTTPQVGGGFGGMLGGLLGGAGQGASLGAGAYKAFNPVGSNTGYLGSGGGYTSDADVLRMRADYMNLPKGV